MNLLKLHSEFPEEKLLLIDAICFACFLYQRMWSSFSGKNERKTAVAAIL